MRVSVITCCWNSEPHIAECIASIQAQTYEDIEMVFVDGGSTDGTLERIKTLAVTDARVRWVTDVRGGISHAMNVGVEQCSGEIFIHLHADDYFAAPDIVEQVVANFRDPGVVWVFGRVDLFINGQREAPRWKMPVYSYARLLKGNFIMHQSLFMRRYAFFEIGLFDTSLKYAMDYDYWLRLAQRYPPHYNGLTVAVFRCHEGSVSTANEFKGFVESQGVRRRYIGPGLIKKAYHELIFVYRATRMRLRGL